MDGGFIEVKEKTRIPSMQYDVIFKSVFTNHEDILGKMISDITGISYELMKDNITLEVNELPISKKNEKVKRCDFIVKIVNDNIIIVNLELNKSNYSSLTVRNLSYIFSLFSSNFMSGEKYRKDFKVIQINLNCYKDDKSKILTKYSLKEEIDNIEYCDNLTIYSLNVYKCNELYYNDVREVIPKYARWGMFLNCNYLEDIPKVTEGIMTNREMNRIMDKLVKLANNDRIMTAEESIEIAEWEKKVIFSDGVEQGLSQGIEQGISQGISQGIEQEKTETIKIMFENDATLEFISKVTGKTIDEIKEITKK